jgi:hypothetical protein
LINIQDNRVLDVSGGKDQEAQAVIVHKNHGGSNQRWNIVYVDEAAKIESKGISKEFGWHINRPFYIRSKMPM